MTSRTRVFAFAATFALSVTPALAETPRVGVSRIKVVERDRVRLTWVQRHEQGPEQTERISRTLALGTSGEIEISNISGDITVTGGPGEEVKIDATKRARGRSEADAKRQLALVQVQINEYNRRGEVRTVYPGGEQSIRVSVDYDIRVPTGTRVTIKSISGDVRTANINGELHATTVSGRVAVTNAQRLLSAKSVSGDVQITSSGAEAVIEAATVSGNLTIKALKARSFDFTSVSGNVIITDATCDRLNVKAISGNVEFSGPLARGGRYELQSHSGDVRLVLAGDVGFQLEASSFSGSVRSDIPVVLQGDAVREDRRRRFGMNQTIKGVYRDGSAILEITTFSGNIAIGRR